MILFALLSSFKKSKFKFYGIILSNESLEMATIGSKVLFDLKTNNNISCSVCSGRTEERQKLANNHLKLASEPMIG